MRRRKNHQKRIAGLAKIKNKIEEEEGKITVQFRKEVSKRQAQKRKATLSDESSSKRQKLDDTTGSIPFTDLPDLLQDMIFEKFDYKSFATFDKCSKHSHSMCVDTNKNFYFENDFVRVENNRWKFKPVPGDRGNRIATMDQLKNANLHLPSLKIMDTVTEDMALFLISQVKVASLECQGGFSCSQELLNQLLEMPNFNELTVNLRNTAIDYKWNVGNIKQFTIIFNQRLSTEDIINLKPNEHLCVIGPTTIDALRGRIRDKMRNGGCTTALFALFNREDVFNMFTEFGSHAELTGGSNNCWTVSNGQNPPFVVVWKANTVYFTNPREFQLNYASDAKFS